MTKPLTPVERETVVTSCDADDHVSIYTAQRSVLGILRRRARSNLYLIEVGSGKHGSTPWAEFHLPVRRVSWAGIVKRGGVSTIGTEFGVETTPLTEGLDPVERQTTMRTSDGDDTVVIDTTQRPVFNALHRKALASDRLIESDGQFRLAVADASWGGFIRRVGGRRANAFGGTGTRLLTGVLERGTGAAA